MENEAIVDGLYEELAKGGLVNAAKHLATDLDWWFHGPHLCQHMMRALTGDSGQPGFIFKPRSMTLVHRDWVIVEGWEGGQAYWVHVWTLKDGVITQFREYFNTWLTVRDLKVKPNKSGSNIGPQSTLWQSHLQLSLCASWSLPGLVLAF